jgi:Flp pilus assembly protein TadB
MIYTHNGEGDSMENGTNWKQSVFLVVFGVLTLLCWCPIGYGAYGPPVLIWGMPSWAVTALIIGVIMFLLELVFLFGTNLTLQDEQLPDMIKSIKRDIK